MSIQMGEYLVGSYLQLVEECDVVDYNVRIIGGGIKGLNELDIIGLKFETNTAFLCEVAVHIRGLNYGGYAQTVATIKRKHANQKYYAKKKLKKFPIRHYMFWSPKIPVGELSSQLFKIEGLEIVSNEDFTERIIDLRVKAKELKQDTGNPAFRMIQIMENLR